jgi:hypothetical protein
LLVALFFRSFKDTWSCVWVVEAIVAPRKRKQILQDEKLRNCRLKSGVDMLFSNLILMNHTFAMKTQFFWHTISIYSLDDPRNIWYRD